jgi:hypothetical protein
MLSADSAEAPSESWERSDAGWLYGSMKASNVVFAILLLAGCAIDPDDVSEVSQLGSGPGGGSSEPPPAPCQAPTTPSQIRYQALAADQPVVFDLPAGCTKYFSIIAKGYTGTEVLLKSAGNTQLGASENPDLYVTITDQVPGPASGGCHSENPAGQPEDCSIPDPNHPNAIFFIKIAARATTALTNVAVLANQY